MARFDYLMQKQFKETYSSLVDIMLKAFGEDDGGEWLLSKIVDFEERATMATEIDAIDENLGKRKKTVSQIMQGSSEESDSFDQVGGIYMDVVLRKRKMRGVGVGGRDVVRKKLKVGESGIEVSREFEEDKENRVKVEPKRLKVGGMRKRVAKAVPKKKRDLASSFRKRSNRLRRRVGKVVNPTLVMLERKEELLFTKGRNDNDEVVGKELADLKDKEDKRKKTKPKVSRRKARSLGRTGKNVKVSIKKEQKREIEEELDQGNGPVGKHGAMEIEKSGGGDYILDVIDDHFDIKTTREIHPMSLETSTKITAKGNILDSCSKRRSSSRIKQKSKQKKEKSGLKMIEDKAEERIRSRINSTAKKPEEGDQVEELTPDVFMINREKRRDSLIQTLFIDERGLIQKGPKVVKSKVDLESMYSAVTKDTKKILKSDNPSEIMVIIMKMKEAIAEIKQEQDKRKELVERRETYKRLFEAKNVKLEGAMAEEGEKSLSKEEEDQEEQDQEEVEKNMSILKENLKRQPKDFLEFEKPIDYMNNPSAVVLNKNFELLSSGNSISYFNPSPIVANQSESRSDIMKTPIKITKTQGSKMATVIAKSKQKSIPKPITCKIEEPEITVKESKNTPGVSCSKEERDLRASPVVNHTTPINKKKIVRFSSALPKPYIDTPDHRIAKYPKPSEEIETNYFSCSKKIKFKKVNAVSFLPDRPGTGIICTSNGSFVFHIGKRKNEYVLKKLKLPVKETTEVTQSLYFGQSRATIIFDDFTKNIMRASFEGFTKISSTSDFCRFDPFLMIKVDMSERPDGKPALFMEEEEHKREKLVLACENDKIIVMKDVRPNCRLESQGIFSLKDVGHSSKSSPLTKVMKLDGIIFSTRGFYSSLTAVDIGSCCLFKVDVTSGHNFAKCYFKVNKDQKITKVVCHKGIAVVALADKRTHKINVVKIFKYLPKIAVFRECKEFVITATQFSFSLVDKQTFLEILKMGNENWICVSENYGKLLTMMIKLGDLGSLQTPNHKIEAKILGDLIKENKVRFYIEENSSIKRQKVFRCVESDFDGIWTFGNFGYWVKLSLKKNMEHNHGPGMQIEAINGQEVESTGV